MSFNRPTTTIMVNVHLYKMKSPHPEFILIESQSDYVQIPLILESCFIMQFVFLDWAIIPGKEEPQVADQMKCPEALSWCAKISGT